MLLTGNGEACSVTDMDEAALRMQLDTATAHVNSLEVDRDKIAAKVVELSREVMFILRRLDRMEAKGK